MKSLFLLLAIDIKIKNHRYESVAFYYETNKQKCIKAE
jgi:hypothetical protein